MTGVSGCTGLQTLSLLRFHSAATFCPLIPSCSSSSLVPEFSSPSLLLSYHDVRSDPLTPGKTDLPHSPPVSSVLSAPSRTQSIAVVLQWRGLQVTCT